MKKFLPLALLAAVAFFVYKFLFRAGRGAAGDWLPDPGGIGAIVNDTINRPQPGTALDNIVRGSWQDFWSFPYRVMNSLGVMPDLPPLPSPDTMTTVPAPDSRLYPGDPGGWYNA